MRTQILATYGATALALGLLLGLPNHVVTTEPEAVTQSGYDDGAVLVPTGRDGIYQPTWEGDSSRSHCVASVDEGLDWYQEGRDTALPQDETSILYEACGFFGHTAEAQLWPDGSWNVTQLQGVDEGIWWSGCLSVGRCMENS